MTIEEFIEEHKYLVNYVIDKKYKKNLKIIERLTNFTYEDLYQIGMMELVKGYKTFDSSIGIKPSTYLVRKIWGTLGNEITKHSPMSRKMYYANYLIHRVLDFEKLSAEELSKITQLPIKIVKQCIDMPKFLNFTDLTNDDGFDILDCISDDKASNDFKNVEDKEILNEFVKGLSKRQLEVYENHFVRNIESGKVADMLGIPKCSVSQIIKKIIDKGEQFNKMQFA